MLSVAVAVPAEPTSEAEPSALEALENVTAPDGVTPPMPVTVAVRNTTSCAATLLEFESRVMLFRTPGVCTAPPPPFHDDIILYTSTEPSPVTWSYPAPALKPTAVAEQLGLRF